MHIHRITLDSIKISLCYEDSESGTVAASSWMKIISQINKHNYFLYLNVKSTNKFVYLMLKNTFVIMRVIERQHLCFIKSQRFCSNHKLMNRKMDIYCVNQQGACWNDFTKVQNYQSDFSTDIPNKRITMLIETCFLSGNLSLS